MIETKQRVSLSELIQAVEFAWTVIFNSLGQEIPPSSDAERFTRALESAQKRGRTEAATQNIATTEYNVELKADEWDIWVTLSAQFMQEAN